MNALRTVVVGLDFTPASRGALRQASRIAARNDAALHVVHAIEPSIVDEMLALVGLGRDQSWAAIRARARELAQRLAEGDDAGRPGSGGVAVGAHIDVEVGSPMEVLCRAVRTHAADLLVLGVRSPTSAGRGAGPVAKACLRHAPTRVLLAREDQTGPYTSVVACTDFSETSYRAVETAVRIARFDKAALRIVHVAMPPGPGIDYTGDPLGLWPGQPVELVESWNAYRASLGPRLEKFVEPLAAELSGVNARLEIFEHGHYGRGIAAYAEDHRADLLVLGAQGRSNLRYALLGSTAERALSELSCSALVVKPAGIATDPSEAVVAEVDPVRSLL